jgi:hypothetical protein
LEFVGGVAKAYGKDYRCKQTFWSYIILEWVPKCEMWVLENWNLPYAGQDTNATIESYHANLKATLIMAKSQLFGRDVDSCIHELLGNVLSHY